MDYHHKYINGLSSQVYKFSIFYYKNVLRIFLVLDNSILSWNVTSLFGSNVSTEYLKALARIGDNTISAIDKAVLSASLPAVTAGLNTIWLVAAAGPLRSSWDWEWPVVSWSFFKSGIMGKRHTCPGCPLDARRHLPSPPMGLAPVKRTLTVFISSLLLEQPIHTPVLQMHTTVHISFLPACWCMTLVSVTSTVSQTPFKKLVLNVEHLPSWCCVDI